MEFSLLTARNLILMVLISSTAALPASAPDEGNEKRHALPTSNIAMNRNLVAEQTSSYWLEAGAEHVAQKVAAGIKKGVAKNVILFIGDGMSLATQAATRVYLGGEEQKLIWEEFPSAGLAKTYSIDYMVPDSACTSTAYNCGVKSRQNTIGVNGHVQRNDCNYERTKPHHVDSFAKWAMDSGKQAGLVTNTAVTHASPAGVYAHVSQRGWATDRDVADDCGENSNVPDIALQLMRGDTGKQLKVVMGGGKAHFSDATILVNGRRGDGLDLLDDFRKEHAGNIIVENKSDLSALNVSAVNRMMGLFSTGAMRFNLENSSSQPKLQDMTAKAIELLAANNDEGYFLFVEGGLIDYAHHSVQAKVSIDETAELYKAVKRAYEMTNPEETLIVVTSDHSHVMSMGGSPKRGNDIFGMGGKANDGLPYMTLSYANGNGFSKHWINGKGRADPTTVMTESNWDLFPSTVHVGTEKHGGEDVGVFASGPWAHLFSGVYEQTTIPHLMAFAACVGNGPKACDVK